MKFSVILHLLFFLPGIIFGDWILEKKTDLYKAYSSDTDKGSYRIESRISKPLEKVLNFLTDFEQFPEIYDSISSLKIIESNDKYTIHYTVMDSPWPFSDRDMVTKVSVSLINNGNIKIISGVPEKEYIPEKENRIRISEFSETIILEKISDDITKMTCTGSINIGGSVPDWLKNQILLEGPVETQILLNAEK